jgi:hypothetical protein
MEKGTSSASSSRIVPQNVQIFTVSGIAIFAGIIFVNDPPAFYEITGPNFLIGTRTFRKFV